MERRRRYMDKRPLHCSTKETCGMEKRRLIGKRDVDI